MKQLCACMCFNLHMQAHINECDPVSVHSTVRVHVCVDEQVERTMCEMTWKGVDVLICNLKRNVSRLSIWDNIDTSSLLYISCMTV